MDFVGKLDRRIVILEKVAVRDNMGGETISYVTFRKVFACVDKSPSRDSNKELSGRQTPIRDALFTIRYIKGLSEDFIIQYTDELGIQNYKINSINENTKKHRKAYIDISAVKFDLDL
jgi:head-tail adaptor